MGYGNDYGDDTGNGYDRNDGFGGGREEGLPSAYGHAPPPSDRPAVPAPKGKLSDLFHGTLLARRRWSRATPGGPITDQALLVLSNWQTHKLCGGDESFNGDPRHLSSACMPEALARHLIKNPGWLQMAPAASGQETTAALVEPAPFLMYLALTKQGFLGAGGAWGAAVDEDPFAQAEKVASSEASIFNKAEGYRGAAIDFDSYEKPKVHVLSSLWRCLALCSVLLSTPAS